MLKIRDEGIILEKTNLEFENKAILNQLFSPKAPWEKSSVVNNVVFPTGAVVKDKKWQYQI